MEFFQVTNDDNKELDLGSFVFLKAVKGAGLLVIVLPPFQAEPVFKEEPGSQVSYAFDDCILLVFPVLCLSDMTCLHVEYLVEDVTLSLLFRFCWQTGIQGPHCLRLLAYYMRMVMYLQTSRSALITFFAKCK